MADTPHTKITPQDKTFVLQKCVDARGAIGAAFAYTDTQQPFAYVHMLSAFAELLCFFNTVYVALAWRAAQHNNDAPVQFVQARR